VKIAIDPTSSRLITLDDDRIRSFDITGDDPTLIAEHPLPHPQWLASSRNTVFVLSGAHVLASVNDGRLTRFGWDLTEHGSAPIRNVERRGIATTPDGARFAYVNWATCQVTLADPVTAEPVAANGVSIPSGASFSPDGRHLIAGTADQGDGDILLFDTEVAAGERLGMTTLPPPNPSPGLDDAPYFSTFSASGRSALLTNESWGGRGLFVYDMTAGEPAWSRVFEVPEDDEDPDNWHPYPAVFAADETLVLAGQPDGVHVYRATDGELLSVVAVGHDPAGGIAVDEVRHRFWVAGDVSHSHPLPS